MVVVWEPERTLGIRRLLRDMVVDEDIAVDQLDLLVRQPDEALDVIRLAVPGDLEDDYVPALRAEGSGDL